ncbi:MAG TPA: 3-isopropylmalate dehydratase small subunit [Ktedonobacterales bacterium]
MSRVWRLGENVNTDQIIPGRYNVTTDRAHLAKYCLCEQRPDFAAGVAAGDVLVAGRNFGCGSSREHAAVALKANGLAAVIAVSFARIFYRNAINIGLPVLIAPDAAALEDGDAIEVDIASGTIHDLARGHIFQAEPLPDFVQRIVEAGGIIPLVRQQGRLATAGSAPKAPR